MDNGDGDDDDIVVAGVLDTAGGGLGGEGAEASAMALDGTGRFWLLGVGCWLGERAVMACAGRLKWWMSKDERDAMSCGGWTSARSTRQARPGNECS